MKGKIGIFALVVAAVALMAWWCVRTQSVPSGAEKEEKGLAHRDDADFPEGGVTTMDGRPVDTGYRFRYIRQFPACIALFLMPTAKSAFVAGDESVFYRKPFETAGIKVLDGVDGAPVDIVLLAPKPDWLKGTDFPDVDALSRFRDRLAKGGVAALHVDARQLTRGRMKSVLADFRSVFGQYMLWCIGPTDYVVTANGNVLADEVFALFADAKAAEAFAATGIYTPAEVFSCYVGRDVEIEPGFQGDTASGRAEMTWQEAKRSLADPVSGGIAAVRAASLMPYYIPPMPWFMRGVAEPCVYASTTNAIMSKQAARREFLVGFDDIGKGISTNAIERWSVAAKVSPRDPILRGLVDVIDLKGRQFLRIGNVGDAVKCYEKLELDPLTDDHRYELIETCAASGHEDIACRQLDVLMKRKPEDPDLRLRAAKLLCMKKNKAYDPERAVKLAEEAVNITGWRTRAYVLGLAEVYIGCGRVRDGVALKRKMKTMNFDR